MIQEQAGRIEEAHETAAELALRRPTFTVKFFLGMQFRVDTDQLATDAASLRRAGVPEG
jgi:hypothetical protein